ncbi:hypothetical protein C0Q70_01682 [Pomacea canaliculata]|uniref:Uncharacterized protein n=1 Tax=Pomacea canaliculata TaxID=400727 RepID=A0A2T7Q058_POMCA|nr:hypothetical protein C0Q70_01682 [Pomacea canaliculata]
MYQNEAVLDGEVGPDVQERQSSVGDITEERSVPSLTYGVSDKSFATVPLTGEGVVVRSYTKSPHYLPLAIIALFLNLPLGLPAVACACVSRARRQRGQEDGANTTGKAAFWLSVIGIVTSLVICIFVIVYFFVMTPNIIRNIEGIT